jgi:AraC family transcriptional regulator, activator of mtrCDE
MSRPAQPADPPSDSVSLLGPMLRMRPELQDFCRFGGGAWRAAHAAQEKGWAAFHIVARGSCLLERSGQAPVRLEAGDVLLLPQGDAHMVYGGGGQHAFRDIAVTFRDYIRVKQTAGDAVETELVCGRLHPDAGGDNLLLATLPPLVILRRSADGGLDQCGVLVSAIRDELDRDRPGAATIGRDLASALFTILLREHLEREPPAKGLLALLAGRDTARAAAAMLRAPAHPWSLDELATTNAVSRATLVRAFRRASGLAPQAFLTSLRLHLARDRIAQTGDGLGQIAEAFGYGSEAALSRALHRAFGVRPGALRGGG